MKSFFLGVDTSNYTTSLCITDGMEIISETRRLLPVKDGERGLRQSDALFHHTKALPELCDELFKNTDVDRSCLRAVGVSMRPRDAEGSYMPCFLAGASFAFAFAKALSVPLFGFSHQCGHIMSAAMSGGCSDILRDEFISFHVSGGTTEVLHVSSLKDRLKCEIIGGTKDLNAGQAIDRCGVAIGLSFPCGAQMDILSQKSCKDFSPKVSTDGCFCNLSGLENITKNMINSGEQAEDVCKFTFSYIGKALQRISEEVRIKYGKLPILYAGGVMSNTYIRSTLSQIDNVFFAHPKYSCDNAFGTACLACSAFSENNKNQQKGQ